ncbi:hypothetical protein PIB30_027325 [Stylosanthes scabra]|uniref:Uncharacterized protein n=1 Tax=Stylosanthes scabra TaxID=79078 RepID=A0ABU6QA39_9FABA|nr:hypothetical protein [Stylosanthes scabra]
MQWQEGDLDYDSEPERRLLRRRREARRRERQAALEQQLNMAAEHHDDNLNLENNQNRVTLGQYINPTTDSCGSTIRRPAIQVNNFELKPSLIQIATFWRKVIAHDDRSEEPKSFSIARILIDSYQWKRIHEWVSIKVDDRVFEVFVNEFGSEVYSVQSHPHREEGDSAASMEEGISVSAAVDSLVTTQQTSVGERVVGPEGNCSGSNHESGSASSSSCPYPPGFGPYPATSNVFQVARANSPNLVWETTIMEGESVLVASKDKCALPFNTVGEDAPSLEEEISSAETLYGINDQVLQRCGKDAECGVKLECANSKEMGFGGDCSVNQETEEESDKFLYLINVDAIRIDEDGCKENLEKNVDGEAIVNENNSLDGDFEKNTIGGDTISEESCTVKGVIEVAEYKQVWDRGGIFFDKEDEVIAKMLDREAEGKKRFDRRQRKKCQEKTLPCVQRRTLATRKLRLGAKAKLK